jgi:hypothetical protein
MGASLAKTSKPNKTREQRIVNEIIVDCYGPAEQAMGWYYYLNEKPSFPFLARCISVRAISPLPIGAEVEVVGMAPESECEHEMFVEMPWERRRLAVPLSQLKVIHADAQTKRAVEDWNYWVEQGYEL